MKNPTTVNEGSLSSAGYAGLFPRSTPEALAAFDPSTKRCSMNCSQHGDDPRTMDEIKCICEDCDIVTGQNQQPKVTLESVQADLQNTQQVLFTLIGWLSMELGSHNVTTLLNRLEKHNVEGETRRPSASHSP